MTEEQLKSMTEQEIRRRFRCAPAYYLQAKLDKKRALEAGPTAAREQEQPRREAARDPARWRQVRAARPVPVAEARRRPATIPLMESLDPPPPLPGFEILDAALAEYGSLDSAAPLPPEVLPEVDGDRDPGTEAVMNTRPDSELTQQAILEAALEDYANWPLRSAPEPESAPQCELERKLHLVLEADPELKRALELEPELEVVLHSDPGLERALDAETGYAADNVTLADFSQHPPRTVPVVSVVMDRKRPNMVRVVGRSTRLAS